MSDNSVVNILFYTKWSLATKSKISKKSFKYSSNYNISARILDLCVGTISKLQFYNTYDW